MATSTRSGRFQKNEDTSQSRCKSAGGKVKGSGGLTTSGSTSGSSRSRTTNSKTRNLRCLTASGSAAPDTLSLRRSTRETPRKKMRSLKPIENPSLSSSPDKKMPESAEKERPPSPLRRSERIERIGAPSSSGSKKSNNSSSLLGKKEGKMKGKKRKLTVVVTKEQSKDNEVETKIDRLSTKRKRLDARSYRSFLKPQAKIAKRSDASRMHQKEDSASQEDTVNLGPIDSKELQEGGAECSDRKGAELKYSDEGCKEAVEGSSSGSRELAELTLGNDGQSKMHTFCFHEAKESKYEGNSPVSRCCDNSLQSSPVGTTVKGSGGGAVERESDCEGDKYDAYRLSREELRSSEPVEFTFVERSFAVDPASRCDFGVSRSSVMTANLNSDNSVTPLKNEICVKENYGAHATSSSPSCTINKNSERCRFCCKLQRMHNDSQALEMCSCNEAIRHEFSTVFEEASLEIQTDTGPNSCVVCKNPGPLLCCGGKGCQRSYHLSCLDPPLRDCPIVVWLCLRCVKKKMESGVYSVSEGIESVWDIKEEMQNGKHYLVKYKGLAHVYNRWILESQILVEAPMLLAKFNKRRRKQKVIRWNPHWTEPHRLLQKRLLMPLKVANEYFSGHGNNSNSYHEWLVKWKDLGYEHATWEFEKSPFLCSSEAISLIKDYESRHEEAVKPSDPFRTEKALQVKKNPLHKLSRLPDGLPPGLDYDHLNSINRLREFWHRSQNAVLIDDQERILKTILFILALQSDICRPFLIISTVSSLPLWETEFARFAPSINIVVYSGNKDVRKMIQTLEFYEGGGCIMFQVLLSYPDAIFEDFEVLECIGWEAMIVDECQRSRISKHFEKLRHLSMNFRLLLLSGQLKDNLAEYLNLLSFLDSGEKDNCFSSPKFDSKETTGTLAIMKERLTHYLAYERKPDASKFVEYWVPVRLSNVQLEQYCATLISNFLTLRSSSRIDHIGALRDILISTRKCCDHPYIVDPLLQSSLTCGFPEGEYLDIGVNASGKLLLLDKVLQEIKSRGLRVLILFQSTGGAGRDSIGDILEDFIRQRFGADTYERVDNGLIMSRKLAALNMFNDKARGRFVFLIENRACLSSTKLTSVDAVIIFDSDWNPLNDIRALQKISIESQSEQVKVFRLYSCCTVEEKVLIFAKQDMILESNIQNISPSVSHSLLSWGASYLFSKLDEFHQPEKLSNPSEISTDKMLLNDVVLDLLAQLPNKAKGSIKSNCSILIKAQQSGSSYSRNIILVGEKEGISSFDKEPPSFWSNLLEGRHPQWRYISGPSQRIRRKVQNSDRSSKLLEAENDEVKKKRRKVVGNPVDPISLQTWLQDKKKGAAMGKDAMMPDNLPPSCSSNQLSPISPRRSALIPSSKPNDPEVSENLPNVGSEDMLNSAGLMTHVNDLHMSPMCEDTLERHKPHIPESEEREKLRNAQSSLHLLLKPELSKLCDILKLPVDVKHMAEKYLEYIMNNRHVSREPETRLQALNISLCLRAASFLKHKVDHKESLIVAREKLNFRCIENEVDFVYSKLRILKKFSRRASALRDDNELNSPGNKSSVSGKDVPSGDTEINSLENKSPISGKDVPRESEHQESEGSENSSDNHRCTVDLIISQDQASVSETPGKHHKHIGSLRDELLKKRIDFIDKTCSKREEELLLKQQVELSDFNIHRESEKMKLMKAHDSYVKSIRAAHSDSKVRKNKIRLLNQEFFKKLTRFDQSMKFQRRKLAIMQGDARNKERQIKDRWLEEAKAGRLAESFDNLPLSHSGFTLEVLDVSEQHEACDGFNNTVPVSGPSSEEPFKDATTTGPVESIESIVKFSEIPSIAHSGEVDDLPVESNTLSPQCNEMNEVEPVEPIGRYEGPPGNVPPGMAGDDGDLTVETESPATVPPAVLGDMPNGGMQDMLVETETSDSRCNNINEVESYDPSGRSVENPVADQPGMAGDMPVETESPASQSDILNAVGNRTDTMPTVSDTETFVDFDQHRGADTSGDACLMSSLQSRAEFSSFSNASTRDTSENCVPSNQGPSVRENERHDVSCVGSEQGFSSPQQSVAPTLSSSDVQIEAINHNPSVSESIQFQLPPSTDIPLVEHCQGSSPASMASEEEPCYQTYGSTQQPEVSMQPSIMAVAVQVEQIDQLVSESIVLPLPPVFTTPERTCSEDLRSTCYQTHCSAQLTDLLSQQPIVATAVHVEQPNQLVSQSVVNPLPPYATTPPEGTRFEDLSSTGIQPVSRSHFLERFPMTNWIPPQGIHPDPLHNELMRICKQKDLLIKMREDKKLQLKLECDQEIEKVRRKYDTLLHDAEADFIRENKFLEEIYDKVSKNQALAEQFRAKFIENRGGASASLQGSRSCPIQQFLQASQPQVAQRPASTLAPPSAPFPTPATLPPPSLASARLRASASAVASVAPAQVGRRASSSAVFLGNQVRPHFSSTFPPPRANLQVVSEPRAPAPHLHRFRPQQNLPLQTGGMPSQQQNLANLHPMSSIPPVIAPLPSIRPPMPPAGSASLPVCRGNTLSPVELPVDAGDPHIQARMPNLAPPRELVPEFDRLFSSLAGIELPPSSEPAAGPTAVSDVVCISDDDD